MGGGKAGQVDTVSYRYAVGGVRQMGRDRVPAGMYARIGPGAPLRVRLISFAGWHNVRLDRPWADYRDDRLFDWFTVGPFAAIGLFVLVKLRHARRDGWRALRREAELVRRGIPAVAVVTHAGARSLALGNANLIRYEYAIGGRRLPGQLGRDEDATFKRLRVGDGLIVLYDRRFPTMHRRYQTMSVAARTLA